MSSEVTLLRPLWLLGLVAVAGLAWWLWTRRGGIGDWDRVADPAFIRAMTKLGRLEERSGHVSFWPGLAMVALCVMALAGPAIERRDTPSFRNLDGVIFVVDASKSVTEHGDWPKMLGLGRYGLASLGTRPGGIIVYAGDAYIASGMTMDHLQLGQSFSLITADLVPDPGTRPERALALAIEQLEQAKVIAGDLVLFTDGAGLGPETLQLAARLPELGARLSVVALGASPAFETHANTGQGRVFRIDEAESFGNWLSQDVRTRLERQAYPLIFWSDLGRYILLLAGLPLLLLFRRERT